MLKVDIMSLQLYLSRIIEKAKYKCALNKNKFVILL